MGSAAAPTQGRGKMISHEIRKLGRRCAALRRRKEALGCQLDQLGTGSIGYGARSAMILALTARSQYAAVDALYGKLFDQLWETNDAILAAPAMSKCVRPYPP